MIGSRLRRRHLAGKCLCSIVHRHVCGVPKNGDANLTNSKVTEVRAGNKLYHQRDDDFSEPPLRFVAERTT